MEHKLLIYQNGTKIVTQEGKQRRLRASFEPFSESWIFLSRFL
jgi:hypothetical protein